MSDSEKELLLIKLREEQRAAFAGTTPNAPALSDIVSQLNALSKEDKILFKDFAVSLKQELFNKNISIKGFNLDLFQNNESAPEIIVAQESRLSEVQIEFDELLSKLTQNRPDHFEILKGYFVIKLENNPLDSYQLVVLHDANYFIQPIKKKISAVIPKAIFKSIDDYEKDLDSGNAIEGNLLCLLLLQPRTNDKAALNKLKHTLATIFDSYNFFQSYSLRNELKKDLTYESSISREDFYEELSYVIGTLLSNGAINNEEEKILKKLCSSFRTPLIIYKSLSGGNSGSKVIEVRPKKELGPEHEKRYIIKYSLKNDERKILKEYESFGKFIEGYKRFNDYECKYEKTLIYEGLRYSYAISDSEADSYSYKQILEDDKNVFHTDRNSIIDELYEIKLFETWSDSLEAVEFEISDLYKDYIDFPKIQEQLQKILDINAEDILNNELIINFKKIWESKTIVNQKICHGDLHTENFFKDKNSVYLIDFGYTGTRHAVLDHTSLECSIKFKHCPFYVGIEELIFVENELLLESSSQLSYKFTSTKRTVLLDLLETIKRIRRNSTNLQVDNNSNTEYLLSLFMMTFRQIRYRDMNQLYAYHSALILSKKLVQSF